MQDIISLLEQRNIDSLPYLEKCELSHVANVSSVEFIEFSKFNKFVNLVYFEVNIPDLGLITGSNYHINSHGLAGIAAMAQKDIKSCLTIAGQVLEYRFPALTATYIERDNCFGIRLDEIIPLGKALPVFIEQVIYAFINIAKEVIQKPLEIQQLRLAYPEPEYSEKYDVFLSPSIEFNCGSTECLISDAILDEPNFHANPETAKTVLNHFQSTSPKSNKNNLFRKIKSILDDSVEEKTDQKYVADKLCISPRTLRRKLGELDSSFADIKNSSIKTRAINYLIHSRKSITEISYLLGYHDASHFSKAFKALTKYAPKEYREANMTNLSP